MDCDRLRLAVNEESSDSSHTIPLSFLFLMGLLPVSLVLALLFCSCMFCCCSPASDSKASGVNDALRRISSLTIVESDDTPILSISHAEILDSLIIISDQIAGVVHILSLTAGSNVKTLAVDCGIVDTMLDSIRAQRLDQNIQHTAQAAVTLGMSVEEMNADRQYKPMLLVARVSDKGDTLYVTGQVRAVFLNNSVPTTTIIPFLLSYDTRTFALRNAIPIRLPGASSRRYLDVSTFTTTSSNFYFRELDSAVFRNSTGPFAPMFTTYDRNTTRIGQDILAPFGLIGAFGYGFQQNQSSQFDSMRHLYTSGSTPVCLLFDSTAGQRVRSVDYGGVLRGLRIDAVNPRYTGVSMRQAPPNAYLCTGFVSAAGRVASVIINWNESADDNVRAHVVVAQFDEMSASFIYQASTLPSSNDFQPVRVLEWLIDNQSFYVFEKNRYDKTWMLSTYAIK